MQTPSLTTAGVMRPSFGRLYWIHIGFGIPWIVFGIQHYIYADFVSGLVPAYLPWRLFWAYFTGTAMLAAGVSFLIRRQVQLAAFLLGCLMLIYLLLVHPPMLWNEPQVGQHWTRFMQDIAIMASAFALAILYGKGASGGWRAWLASPAAGRAVRYCYALPFVVLGAQHFTHNVFVAGKIPTWIPLAGFWDYPVGLLLIAAAYGILFTSHARRIAVAWGIMLTVLALLQHLPLLIANPYNPVEWTNGMLDIALAAGACIISTVVDR